jgi:hypothetical protein
MHAISSTIQPRIFANYWRSSLYVMQVSLSPTSFALTQPPQRVRIIKNIIAHFSISEHANNLLTQERLKHGVRFGLQKVSKIRFGNIYWSSLSVADSLSIIEMLIKDGKLKFKVSSVGDDVLFVSVCGKDT